MNTLETLYFPDTVITTDGQSPLFLFFDLVHFLQPVEPDETVEPATGSTDTFMDKGFCQGHTPAPLGYDRERFLRLVNDIKSRKDDYAAQLSALTVASMSASRENDADTGHGIMSSLLGLPDHAATAEKQEAARQSELWQARLVLKIGEILDREEEEITEALSLLNKSKTEMFARLLGKDEDAEDEDLFTDLQQLQETVNIPRPGMIKNRLKAWLSLYGSTKLPDRPLWTTTRTEAADIFLEMYETKTGQAPVPFWQLELPAATGVELQDHMEKIEAFRKEARPLTGEIAGKFNELIRRQAAGVSEEEDVFPEGERLKEQWAALIDEHFPADLFSRSLFRFYLLFNHSFADLTAPENSMSAPLKNEGTNSILAVIG